MKSLNNRLVFIAICVMAIAVSALAQDNVMTSTASGGNDNWNEPTNWSLGVVPTGTQHAVISAGLGARVDSAAPAYTGGLVVSNNASIMVGYASDDPDEMNVLDGSVTMHEGSKVIFRRGTVTIAPSFEILGAVQIDGTSSTVGHNTTRTFTGSFSGAGSVTFWSGNNNTFNLNAASTISGSIIVTNANCKLVANTNSAFGTANVYSENASSIVIAYSLTDTIGDGAELHLNGVKDGGEAAKLILNSSETVDKLFIAGTQKNAGSYTSASGLTDTGGNPLIAGSGTLTVLTDPPAIPPVITSIEDDVYGGPIWEDYGSAINYTVTFDLDMDDTSVTSGDFENGGGASVVVGTPTETLDGVFTIPVTPTSAGTVILQVKAGATLLSSVAVAMDTASAVPDDTTISVFSGNTPDTTITGTAAGPGGSDDNWNASTNWDYGIPFGPQSAIVGAGVSAQVDTTPRTYTGDLTLQAGSTVQFVQAVGKAALPSGSRVLTMHDGARILTTGGGFGAGSLTFAPVVLAGDATFDGSGSDSFTFTFSQPVSGTGGLIAKGRSGNNKTVFQTANTFEGGLVSSSGEMCFKAESDGAFGTGYLYITNSASLWIGSGLTDAIDDDALLSLSGSKSSSYAAKVILDSDETVGLLHVESIPQENGTWGAVGSSATYQTNLFSGGGILNVRWTEIPPAGTVLLVR